MCNCHSILECCVMFSGVKLSIRSFNLFLMYSNWKCIMKTKVRNFEDNAWADYCVNHPGMHIAQACLKNVTPYWF